MDGATEQVQRARTGEDSTITRQPAPWHKLAVLGALMLATLTFNTAENLPVGLLELISDDLRVSLSVVGCWLLVTA